MSLSLSIFSPSYLFFDFEKKRQKARVRKMDAANLNSRLLNYDSNFLCFSILFAFCVSKSMVSLEVHLDAIGGEVSFREARKSELQCTRTTVYTILEISRAENSSMTLMLQCAVAPR